jgi:hypothetical protein
MRKTRNVDELLFTSNFSGSPGTHRGEFFGVPATGKQIKVKGIDYSLASAAFRRFLP